MRTPKHPSLDPVLAAKAEGQATREEALAIPCEDCGPGGFLKVSKLNQSARAEPEDGKPCLCTTCGGFGWTYAVLEPEPVERTVLEMVQRHGLKVGWTSG